MTDVVPEFLVCRCCRAVFDRPQPMPFCDLDCAGTWASLYVTQPGVAPAAAMGWFVCYQPPDVVRFPAWQQREFDALMREVR